MPSFSVVIPAKNEAAYLPKLLASLKQQTLQPLEVIVADAGSTDETHEIAFSYGARVTAGGLPGVGRNAGAKEAKGEIIFFFDADVYLPDEFFFERAVKEFEEKGLDLATCDLYLADGSWTDKLGHGFYNHYVRLLGVRLPHAPGGCMMVRKSLHEAINGFDETVLFCEDHDYANRANKTGRFGFLDSVKIGVTTRRLDKDGRLTIMVKYVLAELHMIFIGPIRHNAFKYEFDYKRE